MNERKKQKLVINVESEFAKVSPHDKDAEMCVLGAIMIEDCIGDVYEVLKSGSMFYYDAHGHIYNAAIELSQEGMPIDMITIINKLKSKDLLEKVGGVVYISNLTNQIGSAMNASTHASIIFEKYIKRKAIEAGALAVKNGFDETKDSFSALNDSIDSLQAVVEEINGLKTIDFMSAVDELEQEIKLASKRQGDEKYISGYATGFYPLDRITLGMKNGNLVIIAARPGEGKSTLMIQGALHNAKKGIPVGIFSLEMSEQELITKLISAEANIDSDKIPSGTMNKEEWHRFELAKSLIRRLPIFMNCTAGLSIQEMEVQTKSWKNKSGVQIVYIDYLQIASGGDRYFGNREQEIAYIARRSKVMAKNNNIPVVALAQIGRQLDSRPVNERKPMMSDLRESGAIEQDANTIIFLFEPFKHGMKALQDGTSTENMIEIIVAKNRMGKIGSVMGNFLKEYSKFSDLDDKYPNTYSYSDQQMQGKVVLNDDMIDTPF